MTVESTTAETSEGNDVVMRAAALPANSPLQAALAGRADILAMTQQAHDAALVPEEPGGLSHALRAALALRASLLHKEESLADHYRGLLTAAGADGALAALADPATQDFADPRVAAFAAYTDLASTSPKDATADDIEALKAAGIGDADIVRLAELTAFLAYQLRVVAGLKLMQATA
ncbi:hypothetical protein [Pelagibius sp.]|uniref:hypothetical protein n=1 Tax=Pelagibius sp. TaxID=1931238 RepID=UPI003B50A2BC